MCMCCCVTSVWVGDPGPGTPCAASRKASMTGRGNFLDRCELQRKSCCVHERWLTRRETPPFFPFPRLSLSMGSENTRHLFVLFLRGDLPCSAFNMRRRHADNNTAHVMGKAPCKRAGRKRRGDTPLCIHLRSAQRHVPSHRGTRVREWGGGADNKRASKKYDTLHGIPTTKEMGPPQFVRIRPMNRMPLKSKHLSTAYSPTRHGGSVVVLPSTTNCTRQVTTISG